MPIKTLLLALFLHTANGHSSHDERSRIVGGSEVIPHTFPWQVGLTDKNTESSFCGGTIICPKFVLTAAHCMEGKGVHDFDVMVGDHSQLETEASQRRHKVKNIYVHDKWNGPNSSHDYALLELERSIKLKKEVRPLFLPLQQEPFDSATLFVASGWGLVTIDPWRPSPVLKSATLRWINATTCQKEIDELEHTKIDESMVCAGHNRNNSICAGDSGGPLAWIDPKTHEVKIVGINSFTIGKTQEQACHITRPYAPNVFANVGNALNWITQITGDCNRDICQIGECMTEKDLDPDVIRRFQTLG